MFQTPRSASPGCGGGDRSAIGGRSGRRDGQRRLPRTASRCEVHSDVCPSLVAELPCQPHTHVTCWSRCTYVSMTCLSGSSATKADDFGGFGFTGTLLGSLVGDPAARNSRGDRRND